MTKEVLERRAGTIFRHFPEAVLSGALLGLISMIVINYGFGGFLIGTFFVAWISWTTVLAFVLPAVLDDDF